jgi:hypothetical protein
LGVPVIPDNVPSLISGDVMRFRESGGTASKPGTIELHIIQPGRGSSGYYTEEKLRKACEAGVYPKGMLQHFDHPTQQQEEDQPARSVNTLAAVLAEAGHYETDGWDKSPQNPTGAGVYALADVRPDHREDLKWLSGKIGISHYVEGISEETTCPDGKKGRLIKELLPSPFNSVDFVTIPGAGGHSRAIAEILKESQEKNQRKKMADKQLSIRLSELMASDPEVVAELRKQEREGLKIDALNDEQKTKLKEAADRVKTLETENKTLRGKLAEGKAREFVIAQVKEAKLPETAGKVLTEVLVKQVPLAEDGSIDTVKFGTIVTAEVKAKADEIAAILKESGVSRVHDNGPAAPGTEAETKKAREGYRDSLIENGMAKEQASRLAGIEVQA